eukprot:2396060-Rhodomonas_salina.6
MCLGQRGVLVLLCADLRRRLDGCDRGRTRPTHAHASRQDPRSACLSKPATGCDGLGVACAAVECPGPG